MSLTGWHTDHLNKTGGDKREGGGWEGIVIHLMGE